MTRSRKWLLEDAELCGFVANLFTIAKLRCPASFTAAQVAGDEKRIAVYIRPSAPVLRRERKHPARTLGPLFRLRVCVSHIENDCRIGFAGKSDDMSESAICLWKGHSVLCAMSPQIKWSKINVFKGKSISGRKKKNTCSFCVLQCSRNTAERILSVGLSVWARSLSKTERFFSNAELRYLSSNGDDKHF